MTRRLKPPIPGRVLITMLILVAFGAAAACNGDKQTGDDSGDDEMGDGDSSSEWMQGDGDTSAWMIGDGDGDAMGGASSGGAAGTGGDNAVADPLDLSVCDTPGWANALPHEENISVTATFVDGERTVLAEYDLAPVSLETLEAQYPLVVVVAPASSSDPHADYETDGVDDHEQINQATSEVYGAGGGVVFLKAGTYNVGDSVYVWDETVLRGEGRVGARRTMIYLQDDAPSMSGESGIIRVKRDSKHGAVGLEKRVMNSGLSDLVIDGNRDNQAVLELPAKPDDEKKYGYYAEGENIWVKRVTVQNCLGYGFDPHEHEDIIGSTVTITDCFSRNNLNDGFTLDAIHDVVIAHNVSQGNNRHGFNIVTGTENIALCGNVSYENGWTAEEIPVAKGNGITAQNGSDPATPIPNTLHLVDNSVWGNAKVGIDFRMTYDSTIEENYIGQNGSHGIRIRGAENNVISSNVVGFNSQDSGSSFEIFVGDFDQDADPLTPSLPSQGNSITENTMTSPAVRFLTEETESAGLNTISDNSQATN